MADLPRTDNVLCEILKVLERIEARLDGHEGGSQSFEEQNKQSLEREEPQSHDARVVSETSTCRVAEAPQIDLDELKHSRKGTPTNDESHELSKSALKIPYSQWSINQLDKFFNLTLPSSLRQQLGDCWDIPDDDRLPLKFFKSNMLKTNAPWGTPVDSFPTARQPIERDLELLCQFDNDLRLQPGNDFVVIDFDTLDNTRMYRLGTEAVGSELEVEPQGTQNAPWSRLVLYQGATTGDSIPRSRDRHGEPIPYFTTANKINGLWDHLDYHLQCKRRGTTTNPYLTEWNGFQTNFYEVRETTECNVKELWKHGPLYGHPLGWHFRKCAYTIYTPVSVDSIEVSGPCKRNRHWTLLVLAPDYFFDDKNTSFPMTASSPTRAEALGYTLGKLTQIGAELHLIGQGLERITQRWADFLSYFDYILDGGDSLMDPAGHDNLLFDDAAFGRSRKYFWAIDCLTEFELSITDNIVQWELFKAARLSSSTRLPDLDHRQLLFAERQYRVLQNQRESFRQKLASTRALRDALFNASAVIESRASTRLGENVKLLTFVSIFFLPLSFTTSLWSVNDHFSLTVLIYVVIIVALLTYLTMFNINTLAQVLSEIYNTKKKHVVRAMKRDRKHLWNMRGQRFEAFRPKYENTQPSEWYVPLYAMIHPAAVLGFSWGKETAASSTDVNDDKAPESGTFARLLRRRKPKLEKLEEPQPWVIE